MSASTNTDTKVITLFKYDVEEFTMPEKEKVETLLTDPSVADLPVMVLAVVGRCRTGKSFLLNYLLRYLSYLHEKETNTDGGPLGNEKASLDGFPWTNEEEAETKGILLYNHVFKIRMEDNKEVAVIIIDTEGLHGRNKEQILDAVIFALSVKISSFLIFNVKDQITTELVRDLKEGITERHEGNRQGHKPLGPKMMFLVRDWRFVKKFKLGIEGGHHYLSKNFQEQVDRLKAFFKDIQCFLMPYPGPTVAGHSEDMGEAYNGNLAVAMASFKENLKELSEKVFSPENLVVKQSEHVGTCQGIHTMLTECTQWMNELLRNPTQKIFKEMREYIKGAVADISEQIQKYITANSVCPVKQIEDKYECLKKKARPAWENQISDQFNIEPDDILEQIEEQLEHIWQKIKLEHEMKIEKAVLGEALSVFYKRIGENAALDKALSVFDKRFDEALDNFATKDITEMRELKEQADYEALAKLRENLGDGHPRKSYEMKLRQECNLRYSKYLTKNTRNKMVKRGFLCAALAGTGMGVLGYGLSAAINAATTAGGATAITQHIWDKKPNEEESNRNSQNGQRERENDEGKDEASVDHTPKQ